MQLDQNPFFRKAITPWYDSTFACWVLIASMAPVFAFAVGGILVATADPGFSPHTWFPATLGGLSVFLAVKVWFRLQNRSRHD
jgi:hypothetical protein